MFDLVKKKYFVSGAVGTSWSSCLNSTEQHDIVGVQPEGQMEYTANTSAVVHAATSTAEEVNCHDLASLILLVMY